MPYEFLIFMGDQGLTRNIEFDMKGMDFGDGWYASVLTGNPEGTITWTLKFTAHRDAIYPNRWDHGHFVGFQPRDYNWNFLTPDGAVDPSTPYVAPHPVPLYHYLFDFYRRHMANGNTPFLFEDVDAQVTGTDAAMDYSRRSKYLCRFIPNSLEFTQSTGNKLEYECSYQFKQVRGWPPPPGTE